MKHEARFLIAGVKLTERERDTWVGIASDKTVKQIAGEWGLSVKRAEEIRVKLYRKLHVWGVAAVTRLAVKHGLVQL